MSVICESNKGWVVDHAHFIKKVYSKVGSKIELNSMLSQCSNSYLFNEGLFEILTPYLFDVEASNILLHMNRKRKRSARNKLSSSIATSCETHPEIEIITSALAELVKLGQERGLFKVRLCEDDVISNNKGARACSTQFFNDICQEKLPTCNGGNSAENPVLATVSGQDYLIPQGSLFYCCDINKLHLNLLKENQFDFILLDPPWWNKYIRRRKNKKETEGYKLMYNEEVCCLPIDGWLAPNALVAVWCTNCRRHENDILSHWFPRWGLRHIATWFWIKVTRNGVPVCQFSPPPGKQPYERLLLGAAAERLDRLPPDNRCIVSVPSAIHSHKPPLSEVLKPYLPPLPRCLELFARYLHPHWVSAGDQVLVLQNSKLYRQIELSS